MLTVNEIILRLEAGFDGWRARANYRHVGEITLEVTNPSGTVFGAWFPKRDLHEPAELESAIRVWRWHLGLPYVSKLQPAWPVG